MVSWNGCGSDWVMNVRWEDWRFGVSPCYVHDNGALIGILWMDVCILLYGHHRGRWFRWGREWPNKWPKSHFWIEDGERILGEIMEERERGKEREGERGREGIDLNAIVRESIDGGLYTDDVSMIIPASLREMQSLVWPSLNEGEGC